MPGLIALAIAYVFSQFYRSFLAVISPQLAADLGASAADLSHAAGLWFIAFALMQFAVGPSLDRFGPRRTAAYLFGGAGSVGALLFANAGSPATIAWAMVLIGIACSPVLMAPLFIFARRFEAGRFALLTSAFVAFGNLGNVIGTAPMAAAVDAFGWRTVMLTLAIATLGLAMLIFLLLDDPERETTDGSGLGGYLALLKVPALWFILPMVVMAYAPVANLRGLWAGPLLSDLYAADGLLIGRVTLWMALAMVLGSLAYGPMDRWFGTRKWVAFVGNAGVLCALLLLWRDPLQGIGGMTVLLVLIGLTGTSYGVLMAHGRAFVPAALLGRGVTLLNFCSIAGAGLFQFIGGARFAAHADPGSVDSYRDLLLMYALMLALALLLYAFSRDAPPSVPPRRTAACGPGVPPSYAADGKSPATGTTP